VRFTVVAYGSEGDTRPIVALSRGLMEAGHELQMFCAQSAADTVRNHGVSATVLAGDIKATLPIDSPSLELSKSEVMRAIRQMSRLIRDSTASWMEVIHHCGAGTTHTAAQAGVPSVGIPWEVTSCFGQDDLRSPVSRPDTYLQPN
jgi:UDP:flavonoid glycosyltransferase YjiC (YdhE family)